MLVRLRRGRLLSRLSISLASPITTFTGDRSGITHLKINSGTNTNSLHCVNLTAPYGVLYQTEKDEQCAGGHEHVDSLYVGDGRERLLAVGVLGGEGEQGGDPQRYPGRHRLRLDPERDPGHHHDQAGRDVGLEHEVAECPSELECNLKC